MKRILTLLLLVSLIVIMLPQAQAATATTWTTASPDATISVELSLDNNGVLTYSVRKDAREIISSSKLGIQTNLADFNTGMSFVSTQTTTWNNTYSFNCGFICGFMMMESPTGTICRAAAQLKSITNAPNLIFRTGLAAGDTSGGMNMRVSTATLTAVRFLPAHIPCRFWPQSITMNIGR